MDGVWELNADWMVVGGFISAIVAALLSAAACCFWKSYRDLSLNSVFLDMLRGSAAFPLLMFAISPVFPKLGELATGSNQLMLELGAAGGLFGIASDWYRNI